MGGIHEGNDDHEHFPPGSADEGEGIADDHTTMVVGAVEGRHMVAYRYKYNEALREGVGNKQASEAYAIEIVDLKGSGSEVQSVKK